MQYRKDPEAVSPSTEEWCRQCYHRPTRVERTLHAIDALLENHGVESMAKRDEFHAILSYSNPGDVYVPTIYRHEGRWKLGALDTILYSLPRNCQ